MSNDGGAHRKALSDRRVQRTRGALVAAFNRLILERGYAELTPSDVAAEADIGRSTFYEHFRGLDDLLAQTISTVLRPIAQGCTKPSMPASMLQVVEHFWINRSLVRALLQTTTYAVVLRAFADLFAAEVRDAACGKKLAFGIEPELLALQLASGHLAMLNAWASGRSAASSTAIAEAMHATGRAAINSLVLDPSRGAEERVQNSRHIII